MQAVPQLETAELLTIAGDQQTATINKQSTLTMSDAQRFLTALWPDELPGKLILWTLPDKQTRAYDDIHTAVMAAEKLSGTHDVYFGCGLQADKPAKGRGTADTVSAIPGLWADIDVAGDGHQDTGKQYFQDRLAADRWIATLPHLPTMTVWSGGGYHLYWLFKEPMEDMEAAATLLHGWQAYLRQSARLQGGDVDATHDLTRVLRVAGTTNRKHGGFRPVELVSLDEGQRYNPYDFDDFLVAEPEPAATSGKELDVVVIGDLRLSADAEPPLEKFAALVANSDEFRATWTRSRKPKDQSPSGYDLALANYAAAADWTPQETASLLIANRRKHGDDLKLNNPDYYTRTIAKATAAASTAKATDPDDLVDLIDLIRAADPGSDERSHLVEQLLPHVQQATGMPIARIVKLGNDVTAQYIIELDTGQQSIIGDVAAFRNSKKWLDHSYNFAINNGTRPMKKPKDQEWSILLQALMLVIVIIEDAEMGEIDETRSWVRSFTEYCPNVSSLDPDDIEDTDKFERYGLIWFRADGLRKDIALKGGGRFARSGIITRLKTAGFQRQDYKFRNKDGGVKTRSYFTADRNVLFGIDKACSGDDD